MTKYLTVKEVMERYGITRVTTQRWRQAGKGPRPVKIGRTVLYPVHEVERYDREIAEAAGVPPDLSAELKALADRLGVPVDSPGMRRLARATETIHAELAEHAIPVDADVLERLAAGPTDAEQTIADMEAIAETAREARKWRLIDDGSEGPFDLVRDRDDDTAAR